MVNYKLINIIATFLTIVAYSFIIWLVIMIYKGDMKRVRHFGFDEKNSITIDLNKIPLETKAKQNSSSQKKPKIIKISSNTEKKTSSDSRDLIKKEIKDLFSTQQTQDKANETEEKSKQNQARASRLKKIDAKELFKSNDFKKTLAKKEIANIKKILNDVKKDKLKGKYDNKYMSKIQLSIMKQWQNTIGTKDGLKATVTIRIDNHGKLTYKNLKPSFNELFDQKLKEFLKQLTTQTFPRYKGRGATYIETTFTFVDKDILN